MSLCINSFYMLFQSFGYVIAKNREQVWQGYSSAAAPGNIQFKKFEIVLTKNKKNFLKFLNLLKFKNIKTLSQTISFITISFIYFINYLIFSFFLNDIIMLISSSFFLL